MALQTYSDLKASIAGFLNRIDLTAVIPDFIQLAEAQINRRLRTRRMIGRSTATLAGEFIALPSDFGGPRTMQITGPATQRVVPFVEPTQADVEREKYFAGTPGLPEFYTVVGEEFQFVPPPDTSYALQLTYWQRLAVLSVTNASNWVLQDHPDAYLYGALVQSAPYLKDDGRLTVWGTLFTQALDDIEDEDSQAAYAAKLNMRPARVFG